MIRDEAPAPAASHQSPNPTLAWLGDLRLASPPALLQSVPDPQPRRRLPITW